MEQAQSLWTFRRPCKTRCAQGVDAFVEKRQRATASTEKKKLVSLPRASVADLRPGRGEGGNSPQLVCGAEPRGPRKGDRRGAPRQERSCLFPFVFLSLVCLSRTRSESTKLTFLLQSGCVIGLCFRAVTGTRVADARPAAAGERRRWLSAAAPWVSSSKTDFHQGRAGRPPPLKTDTAPLMMGWGLWVCIPTGVTWLRKGEFVKPRRSSAMAEELATPCSWEAPMQFADTGDVDFQSVETGDISVVTQSRLRKYPFSHTHPPVEGVGHRFTAPWQNPPVGAV